MDVWLALAKKKQELSSLLWSLLPRLVCCQYSEHWSDRGPQVEVTGHCTSEFGYGQSLTTLHLAETQQDRNSCTRSEFCVDNLPLIMTATHCCWLKPLMTTSKDKNDTADKITSSCNRLRAAEIQINAIAHVLCTQSCFKQCSWIAGTELEGIYRIRKEEN